MSKHVSLSSDRPRSLALYYSVNGQPVHWYKLYFYNLKALTCFEQLNLFGTAFFSYSIALQHLCYLLRLDSVLKVIDLKLTSEFPGRENPSYLGRRPYTCCNETSRGGLARGKNNAS